MGSSDGSGPTSIPSPSSGESNKPDGSGSAGTVAAKKSTIGPALGGTLGGLASLAILGGAFVKYKRCQGICWMRRTSVTEYVE